MSSTRFRMLTMLVGGCVVGAAGSRLLVNGPPAAHAEPGKATAVPAPPSDVAQEIATIQGK